MPKIPPRPGLEVFVNEGGTVSIKQIESGYPIDDESIVIVHPDDVPRLIKMLEEARDEAASFVPDEPEEANENRT